MLEIIGREERLGARTIRGVEYVVCSAERAVLLVSILHLNHAADAKDVITRESDGQPVEGQTCLHVSFPHDRFFRPMAKSSLPHNVQMGHV